MISVRQKISCLLAIISSFLENCFPPNSFHWQKNRSDQKTPFPLDRKSVSTIWIKDLLENAFLLLGNVASTLKNLKISESIEKTGVY